MSSNPIPRRNSKRFNLTVSFVAAVLIAGLLVFAKPHYDEFRAKKAEAAAATRAPAETGWKSTPQEAQAQAPQPKAEESKPAPDPIATAPLTDQPRAKPRDKAGEQPSSSPAQEPSDPYANLKIDKKGQ